MLRGQFWSVYVPSDLADPHAAVTMTLEQIDTLFALVGRIRTGWSSAHGRRRGTDRGDRARWRR